MHRHEPATDTAKKDVKFEWTEAQQLSYDKLKVTQVWHTRGLICHVY